MPLINIICWFTSSINPLFNFNRRFNFHIQSYSIFHLFWSFYFFPHQPTMCVEWEFCRMKWKMCVWLAREENKCLGWTSKMVTTFNSMHFEKISWIINFLELLSLSRWVRDLWKWSTKIISICVYFRWEISVKARRCVKAMVLNRRNSACALLFLVLIHSYNSLSIFFVLLATTLSSLIY